MNETIVKAIRKTEMEIKEVQQQLEDNKSLLNKIEELNSVERNSFFTFKNINKVKLFIELVEKIRIPIISVKKVSMQDLCKDEEKEFTDNIFIKDPLLSKGMNKLCSNKTDKAEIKKIVNSGISDTAKIVFKIIGDTGVCLRNEIVKEGQKKGLTDSNINYALSILEKKSLLYREESVTFKNKIPLNSSAYIITKKGKDYFFTKYDKEIISQTIGGIPISFYNDPLICSGIAAITTILRKNPQRFTNIQLYNDDNIKGVKFWEKIYPEITRERYIQYITKSPSISNQEMFQIFNQYSENVNSKEIFMIFPNTDIQNKYANIIDSYLSLKNTKNLKFFLKTFYQFATMCEKQLPWEEYSPQINFAM